MALTYLCTTSVPHDTQNTSTNMISNKTKKISHIDKLEVRLSSS